jgi:hypothetical protein
MSSNKSEGLKKEPTHQSPYSSLYNSESLNTASNKDLHSSYSLQVAPEKTVSPPESQTPPTPTTPNTALQPNYSDTNKAIISLINLKTKYYYIAYNEPEILPKELKNEFVRTKFLINMTRFSFMLWVFYRLTSINQTEKPLRMFAIIVGTLVWLNMTTTYLLMGVSNRGFNMKFGSMTVPQIEEEIKLLKANEIIVKH